MARMPANKSSKKSTSNMTKKDVKKIAKEVLYNNSETKTKDFETQEVRVTANRDVDPLVVEITNIAKGGAQDQRIGNEITCIGVKNRMLLHAVENQLADPTVNVPVIIREALIKSRHDKQTTLDSLFIQSGNNRKWQNSTQGEKYLLPFNHNEFDILYQKTHKLGKNNATYTNNYTPNKIVKWYRKQDQQIRFLTEDTTDCNVFYYYVLFVINANLDYSGTGEGGAGACEVTSNLTFYYKDM